MAGRSRFTTAGGGFRLREAPWHEKTGIDEALDGADCVVLLNSHDSMVKKRP